MDHLKSVPAELLKKVYLICFEFASAHLGEKKTAELLLSSFQTIIPYFPYAGKFFEVEENQLRIYTPDIGEKELLAFVIWIQQFIRELKKFLVGLGKIDITTLTSEIKEDLEAIGFYEYYYQARELEY